MSLYERAQIVENVDEIDFVRKKTLENIKELSSEKKMVYEKEFK